MCIVCFLGIEVFFFFMLDICIYRCSIHISELSGLVYTHLHRDLFVCVKPMCTWPITNKNKHAEVKVKRNFNERKERAGGK